MNEISKAVNEALSVPIKIYYDKFSGEIVGSCPQDHKIDIDNLFVIVTRTIADKVFKNISEYMIAFDKDTGIIQPVRKNEIIKLLKPEFKLFEIKKVDNIIERADIAITIYRDYSVLTLALNPAIISRSSMPLLMNQLQFEEGSALNLFITKKNNPNAMLKSIYVDLNDFLSESKNIKTLEYYISDILQNISVDEISIYTRRIFEHYAWQIKDKFITTHKNKGISKRLLGVLESENYHLVITVEASNVFSVRLINDIDSEKYPKSEFIAFLREAKNLYSMSSYVNVELTKLKKNIPINIKTNSFIDEVKALSWRNKNLNIKFIPYASPYN
tara:strand:- start:558 stop:1547 length:990 start_codon:yes stop_codon:yes gene_type:complete